MQRKWKNVLIISGVLLIAGGVFASIRMSMQGIVEVQTGRTVRQDLTSIVTASGEIKPRNYINIGTNAVSPSRITEILVREGDHVRKGQLLAKLESVQPEADVAAMRAAVASTEADSAAAEASVNAGEDAIATAKAGVERAAADVERTRLDFDRGKQLYAEKLIARQDYDTRKAGYDSAVASLNQAKAQLNQSIADRRRLAAALNAAQRRVTQNRAQLRRASDVLERTQSVAPIDGIVSNLPVRVGETVVPGIQNSPSSLIMTIADMSLITAEVKVDETDIVNVKLDQAAEVAIDAIPSKTFRGHVIEIGNTAILRSTGLAANQSAVSSQEAKDFKVVVALDDPPDEIRPGLSATAKITTATRKNSLSIPIQALTVRQKGDLQAKQDNSRTRTGLLTPAQQKARKEEVQGVFVVKAGRAVFHKVETGITGATDIEVLSGLKDGDEIITGSYKIIRTLRNDARVKIDNKSPARTEAQG
ncbi:MAG: efflux RND transporter periplasmic adaptor subunit [Bryobacterales bacterium]|nr:efflux RND transporter periplasmic adaptor subunit [Bryobacterales bacterium]